MAEKILSPGVFTNEIDQSFLPATAGPIGAAIVGPTVKGPVLIPTVVSSYSEYVQIFGETIESGSDKYQYLTSHTAKEYLRQGGPATIVRVAQANQTKATSDINSSDSTGDTYASSSMTFAAVPSGSVTGAPDEITIGTVDYTFVSSSAGLTDTSTQIFLDFPAASGTATTTTTVAANFVLAINDAERDGTTSLGISASSAAAVVTISGSSAGTDANLTVTTGSGGNATATTLNFVSPVNIQGGTNTTTKSTLFTLEALGNGPEFNNTSSLGTDMILTPLTSSATNDQFNNGSFGGRPSNFRWEVSQRNLKKGTFTLLIRQGNDTVKKKQVIETHENLSLDPESTNYILKRLGDTNTTVAVENSEAYVKETGTYPNRSKYVRVSSFPDSTKTPNYLDENGNVTTPKYSNSASFLPALGSGSYGGSFSGGVFGSEVDHPFNFYLDDESDLGNSQGVDVNSVASGKSAYPVQSAAVGGGYRTALNVLNNKDEYDFNLLFIPGIIDQAGAGHNAIVQDAIELCQDRGDCFVVIDNGKKTETVANVKANTEARNTSYAATYYPWVQIQDASLGTYRFVPPSVVIAGVYHFNDTIGQPWFAPAGLNRGGIDSAVQAYRKLSQTQRDELYDSNVNPIATFPGQGVTVFGQKTMQKKASALDRVNVRRLLINVKKFVAQSSRNLVFEQNTTDLRNQFLNVVNPYLEQVQANSGLNAFRVVMDDTNNTPETIDRNQLIGQIFLQPARTAEFIVLDFVVQPTGAAFPE
jgi:hypothetical protein